VYYSFVNISDSKDDVTWSLIEAFVRVADAGSLTHAARQLHVSQPTLSRQIQTLEEQLGVGLFVRHARGLRLSERGADLLAAAREVDDKVQTFLRRATGLREEPEGSVRISAAEPVAIHVLMPALAQLRAEHPRVSLELVADNSASNLSRREADVAVRMFRPTQPDLVAKRLGRVELGLYASRAYLKRHGEPRDVHDVEGHTLIGFDRDAGWHATIQALGLTPELFTLRTDSIAAQTEAVRAGVGIGALHANLARRDPELVRLLVEVPIEPLEVWLVVHQDVRANAAVRAALAALERVLRDYLACS
jgi:DNA-binding transcriptional LysR family regulator